MANCYSERVQPKPDWKLAQWRFEADADPAPGGPSDAYVAVPFRRGAATATVVFDRHGAYQGHRVFGLSVHEARYVRWSELLDRARNEVKSWVLAYDAGRDPVVKAREAEARELLANLPDGDDSVFARQLRQQAYWQLADLRDGFGPPPRPGRAGLPDIIYVEDARAYVERCVLGGEKVAVVARSLGYPQPTFSGRLDIARDRKLLTGRPGRGQVAGSLTPKAKRLLAAAAKEAADGNR